MISVRDVPETFDGTAAGQQCSLISANNHAAPFIAANLRRRAQ